MLITDFFDSWWRQRIGMAVWQWVISGAEWFVSQVNLLAKLRGVVFLRK